MKNTFNTKFSNAYYLPMHKEDLGSFTTFEHFLSRLNLKKEDFFRDATNVYPVHLVEFSFGSTRLRIVLINRDKEYDGRNLQCTDAYVTVDGPLLSVGNNYNKLLTPDELCQFLNSIPKYIQGNHAVEEIEETEESAPMQKFMTKQKDIFKNRMEKNISVIVMREKKRKSDIATCLELLEEKMKTQG